MSPRYPDLTVRLHSRHPLALVSAVRHELRRAGAPSAEIHRFTELALASAEPSNVQAVCRDWAHLDVDDASGHLH